MPDANRAISPQVYLLEALVRGEDVLELARKHVGWSLTQVLDWVNQPWVQMHLEGARELEDVRFDFMLARVRGPVTRRLAELALADGVLPETQRKAAEEVARTLRARDRRRRATTAPPEVKHAAPEVKHAAPEVNPAPQEVIHAAPEVNPAPPEVIHAAPEAPRTNVAPARPGAAATPPRAEAAAAASPVAGQTGAPVDALPERQRQSDQQAASGAGHVNGFDRHRAGSAGGRMTDRHVCPTGDASRATDGANRPTQRDGDSDRTARTKRGRHRRLANRKQLRALGLLAPAATKRSAVRGALRSANSRDTRGLPQQRSRPPPHSLRG